MSNIGYCLASTIHHAYRLVRNLMRIFRKRRQKTHPSPSNGDFFIAEAYKNPGPEEGGFYTSLKR